MSEEKKKTTRAAKLSGLLSGLGAWALLSLVSVLVGVFFAQVLGIGILENDIGLIVFMALLFLLGPVLAVFVGRFINSRWESYTNSKKYLLNIISLLLLLALPFLFFVQHHHENNGLKTFWYKNGEMKNQVNLKNGKMDGLFKGWYENGNKKLEKNFKDGKRDGSSVMWYENGQKMEEIMYKNDQKDGLETQWHENGNKKIEVNVINDKYMDYVRWYEDGQKESERYWVEELKSFLVNEWYENGMKKIEREWDGEDLIERRYNNKGEPIGLTIDTKAKSRVKANNP